MMLVDETVLTFSEASAALPRLNGKKLHASTLWRWARKGLSGVRLETRKIGGRFVTSLEALERFSKELAEQDLPKRAESVTQKPTSNGRRQQSIQHAESVLRQGGIL